MDRRLPSNRFFLPRHRQRDRAIGRPMPHHLSRLFRLVSQRFALLARPAVVPHGVHSPDWMDALGPSGPVWTILDQRGTARPAGKARFWPPRRVLLPLMEGHIAGLPLPAYALVPDAAAIRTFADKAAFADYAEAQGLAAHVPVRYRRDRVAFPAVLKRTDLNAGSGIAVVMSQSDLAEKLAEDMWAGHAVELQELVASSTDYVIYVVCAGGRIVWHTAYAYRLPDPTTIRGPVQSLRGMPFSPTADELAVIEAFLKPLNYEGPANIDYRRRQDGRMALFEINPRLGGSLMKPEYTSDLADCIDAIVRHARWRTAH